MASGINPLIKEKNIMNPHKKVLITLLSFFTPMLLIACLCSTSIPTPTPFLDGTVTAQPQPIPMPGLAGTWNNPESGEEYVIAWQNDQYVVLSSSWHGTSYPITSQSWTGSSLTWTYDDLAMGMSVTLTTTSLSGDSLNINWSLGSGDTGTFTLLRGSARVVDLGAA
jgi:hypothetical protein